MERVAALPGEVKAVSCVQKMGLVLVTLLVVEADPGVEQLERVGVRRALRFFGQEGDIGH